MENVIMWIAAERNNGTSWEEITSARQESEAELEYFLNFNAKMNHWPQLSIDEWRAIVDAERSKGEALETLIDEKGTTVIRATNENNEITVPQEHDSAWHTYKRHLLKEGFGNTTVDMIEDATVKTLRCLSRDTRETGPLKGMVVGNVQSGKTSNMAALMAMAADYGWNMFIILTGLMENLRLQTQARILSDLEGSRWNWVPISNPKSEEEYGKRLRDKNLAPDSRSRYVSLCLKQHNRLDNLLNWLYAGRQARGNVRLLVIDDECDQASINTSTNDSPTEINKRILHLINNRNSRGKSAVVPYQSVNYIGYTATPYANVLNEGPGMESLYPKDFIAALSVSDMYIGPQQIFGYEGDEPSSNFPGLDIVRNISTDDVQSVHEIEAGDTTQIPDSLVDAICWFVCGVACMRFWGVRKPVSMLIHTSYQVLPHERMANKISQWFKDTPISHIMDLCEEKWIDETTRFTKDMFRKAYPTYGTSDGQTSVADYPAFDDLRAYITDLLAEGLTNIMVNTDDQTRSYNSGIHLCVDNSQANDDPTVYKRLIYPARDEMPDLAPAFLVIGGNTLSRGLTIEGLLSTYFLRPAGSADTLMQMGRWFGYRRGYELLPRIWMPTDVRHKFEFISEMDQKLRDEIRMMSMAGISPENYGPKVMASPTSKGLQVVAKNKMQAAVGADYDFTGHTIETAVFDNDETKLDKNMAETRNFLQSLGRPAKVANNPYADRNHVWKDVSWNAVKQFLKSYYYSKRQKGLNEMNPFIEWMSTIQNDGILDNWNVILAGVKESKSPADWHLSPEIGINKINRTRRYEDSEDEVINISTLRSFNDFLSDVDLPSDDRVTIKSLHGVNHTMAALNAFREAHGLGRTPQLVVYIIDKDSMPKPGSSRFPLNAKLDIAGVSINIPGYRTDRSAIRAIHISLNGNNKFAD